MDGGGGQAVRIGSSAGQLPDCRLCRCRLTDKAPPVQCGHFKQLRTAQRGIAPELVVLAGKLARVQTAWSAC